MSGCAFPSGQHPQHGAGGTLIDIPAILDRVLALTTADGCIVIGRLHAKANLRWANNTVTTNGATEQAELSVVSIIGRRVASVTRTYFPPERLDEMVRESEAACERRPEAPDYMPLLGPQGREAARGSRGPQRDSRVGVPVGAPASGATGAGRGAPRLNDVSGLSRTLPSDWHAPRQTTDIHVFDAFTPKLGATFARARRANLQTFGYAEHSASTVWLATSTGLRRRHLDRIGKVEITAKTPDFSRSSWVGAATLDFSDIEPQVLFDTLEQRLAWSARRIDMPAGQYEVLLEPSCAADLAIGAYFFMTRRDADEGRSPFSRPGGGTRIGERLFGEVTLYSNPSEPRISVAPFHTGVDSGGATSVFDNGLPLLRTDWVRDGELRALITPRYWASRLGVPEPSPYINNLILSGDGPALDTMIAQTERALVVTCFWYIRTVDPQTALQTGLTRDGVFLVEHGEIKGAVNNFRWNMSPIAALAQATQIGRSGLSLPREHDEFLRAKAPPLRIERFNMSSVSEAS